jgi:hypothetical protein
MIREQEEHRKLRKTTLNEREEKSVVVDKPESDEESLKRILTK